MYQGSPPKKKGGFDPMDLFPEETNSSRCREAPSGLGEKHRRALGDVDGDHFLSHHSRSPRNNVRKCRAALVGGTWLKWPFCPRREPTRPGGNEKACR